MVVAKPFKRTGGEAQVLCPSPERAQLPNHIILDPPTKVQSSHGLSRVFRGNEGTFDNG
jgi:hypothetical protein